MITWEDFISLYRPVLKELDRAEQALQEVVKEFNALSAFYREFYKLKGGKN